MLPNTDLSTAQDRQRDSQQWMLDWCLRTRVFYVPFPGATWLPFF
jgi:hypothetical protein